MTDQELKDRIELGELIGRTIHRRMVGTERTDSSFEDCPHPDTMFARMSAFDILDVLATNCWRIVKEEEKS